jgi:non-specific serine/threonine protein kinase/serine/threonine-protein kinase
MAKGVGPAVLGAARWKLAKEIVADAVELDEAESRTAFIAERCGNDQELRAEVDSLVNQTTTGIEKIAGRNESSRFAVPALFAPGERVGRYAVLKEIGRGGMGAVYLAERADGEFEQVVALKVLKRGLDTDAILARFGGERRILARLHHPNIARLLDAGTTQAGVPYFVMEYVEGIPVTQFATEHRLTQAERLALFRLICAPVSYAHRNLVVHRDLKPTNVLVAPDRTVKLLDFGIAKLLQETGDERPEVTVTAQRLMTPEYASPEQLRGDPVTTVSDVFSLGVLLYELVTGQRPYRAKSRRPEDLNEAITFRPPSLPSASVVSNWNAAGDMARSLRGDLDNIILKALRVEPERRYASVDALAADLERYGEGMPVQARKDTLGYRVSKFVRRHRVAVIAAGLVGLSLLGGITVAVWQARRATIAQHRAEERFQQVRRLAHTVLFDYHDQISTLPGSTKLRETLVRDALSYLDNLSREVGNDTGLQRELATAYEKAAQIQGNDYYANLGDTSGALASYKRSLALRLPLLARDPSSLTLQEEVANSHRGIGDIFSSSGDLNAALAEYETAVELQEKVAQADPGNLTFELELSEIHNRLGDILGMEGYENLGKTAEALAHYRRAVAIIDPLAASHPDDRSLQSRLAELLSHLGRLEDVSGNVDAALTAGRRAVSIVEQLVATNPNQANNRMVLLAAKAFLRYALLDADRLDESIAQSRTVVEQLEAMARKDEQDIQKKRSLSVAYNALASDLLKAGKPAEAIEPLRKALEIAQARFEANPKNESCKADLAFTFRFLGEIQAAGRDFNGALESFQRSLGLREAAFSAKAPGERTRAEVSLTLADEAQCESDLGYFRDATAHFEKAIALARELSEHAPSNARLRAELALRYFGAGRLEKRMAEDFSVNGSEKQQRWQRAKEDFANSLGLWEALRQQNALFPVYAGEPDKARRELASCEAALR